MSDVNCVVLVGRLTRDAQLKTTANGTAVSKFSIAVNRRIKKGEAWTEESNFFDVLLSGKIGGTYSSWNNSSCLISVSSYRQALPLR